MKATEDPHSSEIPPSGLGDHICNNCGWTDDHKSLSLGFWGCFGQVFITCKRFFILLHLYRSILINIIRISLWFNRSVLITIINVSLYFWRSILINSIRVSFCFYRSILINIIRFSLCFLWNVLINIIRFSLWFYRRCFFTLLHSGSERVKNYNVPGFIFFFIDVFFVIIMFFLRGYCWWFGWFYNLFRFRHGDEKMTRDLWPLTVAGISIYLLIQS